MAKIKLVVSATMTLYLECVSHIHWKRSNAALRNVAAVGR